MSTAAKAGSAPAAASGTSKKLAKVSDASSILAFKYEQPTSSRSSPRGGGGSLSSSSSSSRQPSNRHRGSHERPMTKAEYVQANFQLVLSSTFADATHGSLFAADSPCDWDQIECLRVPVSTPSEKSSESMCPICLTACRCDDCETHSESPNRTRET
jgi:hypothetical protein